MDNLKNTILNVLREVLEEPDLEHFATYEQPGRNQRVYLKWLDIPGMNQKRPMALGVYLLSRTSDEDVFSFTDCLEDVEAFYEARIFIGDLRPVPFMHHEPFFAGVAAGEQGAITYLAGRHEENVQNTFCLDDVDNVALARKMVEVIGSPTNSEIWFMKSESGTRIRSLLAGISQSWKEHCAWLLASSLSVTA